MRIIAFVLDPPVIERILRHIGEPVAAPPVPPPRSRPQGELGFEETAPGDPWPEMDQTAGFGGPLEIIEDGVSGFHVDPNHGVAAAERMAEFFARCAGDPGQWDRVSQGALDRVAARYTWAR